MEEITKFFIFFLACQPLTANTNLKEGSSDNDLGSSEAEVASFKEMVCENTHKHKNNFLLHQIHDWMTKDTKNAPTQVNMVFFYL